MAEQTIDIDCAPGSARPDTYIKYVVGPYVQGDLDKRIVGKWFGNWTWDFSDIPSENWESWKDYRGEKMTELYNKGCIRYGSW